MSQQVSECYIYDVEQGLQTFTAPPSPTPSQTPSPVSQLSSESLTVSRHRQGSLYTTMMQEPPQTQTPPTRIPQRMQSNPQLRQTRAESQARSPLISPSERNSLEGGELIPRLASGRSSLGDIERPEPVQSIGVSRNGVRGRHGRSPSPSPNPLPPHVRASSSYPSRIKSPSPAPSSTNRLNNHPESLKIRMRESQGQTPSPHHSRSDTAHPRQAHRQLPPPASSAPGGEQAGCLAQEGTLSPRRVNAINTRPPPQSSHQRPRQSSPTGRPIASAPAPHHRSRDYGVEPQIEMKSFIDTSLPEPRPFGRIPTHEAKARREKYSRPKGLIGDEEDGSFEDDEKSWWRQSWLRWVMGLLVWGLLCFVIGGALGLGMR